MVNSGRQFRRKSILKPGVTVKVEKIEGLKLFVVRKI